MSVLSKSLTEYLSAIDKYNKAKENTPRGSYAPLWYEDNLVGLAEIEFISALSEAIKRHG